MGHLFEKNQIHKTYITYVKGILEKEITLQGYLSSDETSIIRKKKKLVSQAKSDKDKFVCTEITPIKSIQTISKLFAKPITGRTHQIRASLYSTLFPILGDKIYGEDENHFINFIEKGIPFKQYGIGRQALHSYKIEFIHPFTKDKIEIIAEEPEDMKSIFNTVIKDQSL
jgi:23S rRNA-/tRNA-specific pseudouridylate synthase